MKLTPRAARSTTTSPGPGTGSGASPGRSTSGPPVSSTTMARMRGLLRTRGLVRDPTLPLRLPGVRAVQPVHGEVVEDDHEVAAPAGAPGRPDARLRGALAVVRQRFGVDRLQHVLAVEPQVEGDRVGLVVQFAGEVERVDRRFAPVLGGGDEPGEEGVADGLLQVGGALLAPVAADLGRGAVHSHAGVVGGDGVVPVV